MSTLPTGKRRTSKRPGKSSSGATNATRDPTRRVPAARTVLSVEGIQRNGRWKTCDLEWLRSTDDGSQIQATATYDFKEAGIEVRLTRPAGPIETVRVAACAIFSPLLRIYAGETVHRLCRCDGGRVLVPWIGPPGEAQRLFRPEYSERRVRKVGAARIRVDGRSRSCAEFDYSGARMSPAHDSGSMPMAFCCAIDGGSRMGRIGMSGSWNGGRASDRNAHLVLTCAARCGTIKPLARHGR